LLAGGRYLVLNREAVGSQRSGPSLLGRRHSVG
jgi:hypothetical protein